MNRTKRQQQRLEKTQQIAFDLYQRRIRRGYAGSSEQDWKKAKRIARSPVSSSSFRLNQWLTRRWRRSVEWYESTPLEHALDTLNQDLKNIAVFDLLSLLANITIIISLVAFLTGGERQRHDEQVYAAWQVITGAYDQPGNGGRKRALEFLNSTPGSPGRRRWFGRPWPRENLQGVDVSKASLINIELPKAFLWSANFQGANLLFANLQEAGLLSANLQDADLGASNFQKANLSEANLQRAFLWSANFREANLFSTNLQETNLSDVNLQGTNLRLTELQGALLLATDLRDATDLTPQQLDDSVLCHVALPTYITTVNSNRDCDAAAQLLVTINKRWAEVHGGTPITLEQAQAEVERLINSVQWAPLDQ